jgi:hypothetical protein
MLSIQLVVNRDTWIFNSKVSSEIMYAVIVKGVLIRTDREKFTELRGKITDAKPYYFRNIYDMRETVKS